MFCLLFLASPGGSGVASSLSANIETGAGRVAHVVALGASRRDAGSEPGRLAAHEAPTRANTRCRG